MRVFLSLLLLIACVQLSGCSTTAVDAYAEEPVISPITETGKVLATLPKPKQKLAVSVYEFQDQTGQNKASDGTAEFSRAVTQGGLAILVDSLVKAGGHKWFDVIERHGLNHLLQERSLIRTMRDQYRMPDGSKLPQVAPMLYAGMLLEGGIISYDSNILTGGVGARYLGIGGKTDYRRDIVSVYLRAISVEKGDVVLSINTSKTIFSTGVTGSVYKFVALDKILEMEAGFTANEPPQFAVRQAIESAVYALIMEGVVNKFWGIADMQGCHDSVVDYLTARDGKYAEQAVNQPDDNPEAEAAIKENLAKDEQLKVFARWPRAQEEKKRIAGVADDVCGVIVPKAAKLPAPEKTKPGLIIHESSTPSITVDERKGIMITDDSKKILIPQRDVVTKDLPEGPNTSEKNKTPNAEGMSEEQLRAITKQQNAPSPTQAQSIPGNVPMVPSVTVP